MIHRQKLSYRTTSAGLKLSQLLPAFDSVYADKADGMATYSIVGQIVELSKDDTSAR